VTYLPVVVAASTIAFAFTVTNRSAQSTPALSALTVPAAALPDGCALTSAPAPSPARWSRFPTNPWSGMDRERVAAVHQAIDATPARPLPDLPPTAWSDTPSEMKWAENILGAYRAAYVSADGRQVEVFAVQFNDVKLTTAPESIAAMLNPPRGLTARLVRGATVVRVSASTSSGCFGAVRAYIESLK
jgi:hypothetical protein